MTLRIIQEKLKAPKSQFNSFGKYHYRNCEDILEAVKPLLKETDTYLTLNDEIVMVGERYYVKATVQLWKDKEVIAHTQAYAREEETKKGMDASQITGAASSYARKYALNGLFCIDDNKDSDSTNKGQPDSKLITETQAQEIEKIIKDKNIDKSVFLTWAKADSVGSIQSSNYGICIARLNESKGRPKTIVCPESDGKDVPLTKCESCSTKKGCPSWE